MAGKLLKSLMTVKVKMFSEVGRRDEGLVGLKGRIMDSDGSGFNWLGSNEIGVREEGWLEGWGWEGSEGC